MSTENSNRLTVVPSSAEIKQFRRPHNITGLVRQFSDSHMLADPSLLLREEARNLPNKPTKNPSTYKVQTKGFSAPKAKFLSLS